MQNVKIRYELSEDLMKPHKVENLVLDNGAGEIKLGTMRSPGFLRCFVYVEDGEYTYTGVATAGFEPDKIQPTTEMPADFDEFWQKALQESANIALEPVITPVPELCTAQSLLHLRRDDRTQQAGQVSCHFEGSGRQCEKILRIERVDRHGRCRNTQNRHSRNTYRYSGRCI